MRITALVFACTLAVATAEASPALDASAQIVPAGMGGGAPSGGASTSEMKPSDPLPAGAQDPAERSARSIECAQKADARALRGKIRKRFLHECRSGV